MQEERLSGILIAASLLMSTAPLVAADYPTVAGNVSFDAVLALPTGAPVDTIRYGDAEPQFAELWLPEGDAPAPTVVFIHGGCWLNAYGIDHSRALVTALTLGALGVAVITLAGASVVGRIGWLLLVLLAAQLALGIANVRLGLPLPVATAHNAVAALLCLALVTLLHCLFPAGRKEHGKDG